MTTNIFLAAALWLLALACAVLAIVFALLPRRGHLLWPGLGGVFTVLISGMGLTSWSPLGFFPSIGYTWSNDSFELAITSSSLFLMPMGLGVAALLVVVWRRKSPRP